MRQKGTRRHLEGEKVVFYINCPSLHLRKSASCVGGEHFFRNYGFDPYVWAWWGRKAEMLKKYGFEYYLLRVKARNKTPPPLPPTLAGGAGLVEKVRFLIKTALCRHLELCFLCRRGAHVQKNNKIVLPKCKKCGSNHVGYVKMSPT